MSQLIFLTPSSGPGSGTVTSISAGTSITLTPNPITTTGTVALTTTGLTVNDGTVYWNTGTGTLNTTATGTSGQILTSNGAGVAPTYQAIPGGLANSFPTDSGTATPSAGVLNIIAGNSTRNCGSSVLFTGAGNTVTLNVTDALQNTFIGKSAGQLTVSGNFNVGVGQEALTFAGGSNHNIGIGYQALNGNPVGSGNIGIGTLTLPNGGADNVVIGFNAGKAGSFNVGIGYESLNACTASTNTAIGYQTLKPNTGSGNTVVGYQAGTGLTAGEGDNVLISNIGMSGDNGAIRIGTNGTQTSCYISGIDTVDVGAVVRVLTMASDQLGTADITAGTGIVVTPTSNTITIDTSGVVPISFVTDSGTATPDLGVLNIIANRVANECGATVSFSAPGPSNTVQLSVTDAQNNTLIGRSAGTLTFDGTCSDNVAIGGQLALSSIATSANENIAIGSIALSGLTTGGGNIAIGTNALGSIAGFAENNVCVGFSAGSSYMTTESNNIIIGNEPGFILDSGVIRIGTNGTQRSCYIAGIDLVDVGSVAKVLTMASDQLGTAVITAGTGITITPTANTITISATGTTNLTYTAVSTTPYVVLTTDEYIAVDSSGGTRTIQLPNTATSGRVYIIKDKTGSAATNNITVTTVGGAVNIDGATTLVMNTAYEAVSIMGNGTTYEIF